MTDYTKMDGPTLLHECGMDGMKWAEAFCQHNPECGLDKDDMVVWFANAIMHTYDTLTGTVHNGDHAEWLIENKRNPDGSKA